MRLNEVSDNNPPRIVATRSHHNTLPYVDVHFPATGTVWRYEFQDQALIGMVLRKYRRNVGRLVAKIREQTHLGKVAEINVTKQYQR